MSVRYSDLEDEIRAERQRRQDLADRGEPMHYWRERGDAEPPTSEYWCGYCAGFYGVPHETGKWGTHRPPALCRNLGSALGHGPQSCRQCACIDCVVAEKMAQANA